MNKEITISELYIHPLKSAASVPVNKSVVDALGLENDRRWMLVDDKGDFLSQRQLPEMCLIDAQASNDGLSISVPGQRAIKVTARPDHVRQVVVWGDSCRAYDAGDAAAKYVSDFLKTSCRLVCFPSDEKRQIDLNYAKPGELTGFSDGFPLLLISQASLDDLNARLDKPVSMTRFRPNIVVSGCEAYAEDDWKHIVVGEIEMRVVKPCSRCSIPSVNPETAVRSLEPVKALREYRMKDSKIYFGQNIIANSTGVLEVGMSVEVY